MDPMAFLMQIMNSGSMPGASPDAGAPVPIGGAQPPSQDGKGIIGKVLGGFSRAADAMGKAGGTSTVAGQPNQGGGGTMVPGGGAPLTAPGGGMQKVDVQALLRQMFGGGPGAGAMPVAPADPMTPAMGRLY